MSTTTHNEVLSQVAQIDDIRSSYEHGSPQWEALTAAGLALLGNVEDDEEAQ